MNALLVSAAKEMIGTPLLLLGRRKMRVGSGHSDHEKKPEPEQPTPEILIKIWKERAKEQIRRSRRSLGFSPLKFKIAVRCSPLP